MNKLNKKKSLSNDVRQYYHYAYNQLMSTGAVGFAAQIMHESLERFPFTRKEIRSLFHARVLEVGAGNLEHSRKTKIKFETYLATDLYPNQLLNSNMIPDRVTKQRLKMLEKDLYASNQTENAQLTKESTLKFLNYANIENQSIVLSDFRSVDVQRLPYSDLFFDLVIAGCVLIHVERPLDALEEMLRVTKEGGLVVLYIPNEGSLPLILFQKIVTRRKQKKYGFDGESIHFQEHRYQYKYLTSLIAKKENRATLRSFPFPFFPYWLNLWTIVTIDK